MNTGRRITWYAFCCIMLLVVALPSTISWAAGPKGKHFGAGLYFGEPTGITVKGYLSDRMAVMAIGAWSFIDEAVTLIGDVTYDFTNIPVHGPAITIPFYAGGGVKLGFDKRGKNSGRTVFGAHIPVGIALHFNNHPVELSFEIAPGVQFAPSTEFDLTGGLGVRFYF